MTNYIGFMSTLVIILAIMVLALTWACVTIFRINRAQKKVIRELSYERVRDGSCNRELYLDCQTLLLLLYDVVMSDNVTMEYKSTVIRSSLLMLGIEHDDPYDAGRLRCVIESPDIDDISKLVADVINTTYAYSPDDKVFTDPKTLSALAHFNIALDMWHTAALENQKRLDGAIMDTITDSMYREAVHDVKMQLSQRAQAMMA